MGHALDFACMLAAQRSGIAPHHSSASSTENSLDWREIVAPVEPFLQAVSDRLEAQIKEFDPDIAGYAEYALTGQGKQLRPALVALSANAVGKLNDSHVLVAVIIEMIHL